MNWGLFRCFFFHIFPWVVQWVIYFLCSWVWNVLLFLQSCKHRTFHLYAFSWCGDNNSRRLFPSLRRVRITFLFRLLQVILMPRLTFGSIRRYSPAPFSDSFHCVYQGWSMCVLTEALASLVEIGRRISISSFLVASLAASFEPDCFPWLKDTWSKGHRRFKKFISYKYII